MESGLYVTFLSSSDSPERELPPVGALDAVVLRHRQLVADRGPAHQSQELGVSIDRWLEAELEYQRAIGQEPGGPKRPEMRFSAPDGVFLRFVTFGDARERDLVPELGPFAVIYVGPRGVEADGQVLATRAPSELAAWELTTATGDKYAGLHKPDIAFRTINGAYHRSITPALPRQSIREQMAPPPVAPTPVPPPRVEPTPVPPPRVEPAFTPPPAAAPPPMPREERPVYTPPPSFAPPEARAELTPTDIELIERIERDRREETLRSRIKEEERRRLGVDESDGAATTWAMRYRTQPTDADEAPAEVAFAERGPGELLWQMRFALIGILLLSVGLYAITAIQGGGASVNVPGQQQITTVGVAQKVTGTRWEYVVNSVQRVPEAGNVQARGVFYVVRVGVTNKTAEGASMSPSAFTLIDANGVEHTASGLSSGVYQGDDNPGSPNIWPKTFPVGKTVTFGVVFEVEASLPRGNLLAIDELPRTRVRLD